MGAPLIADYFDRAGLTGNDVVVVSPDHGGVTRAFLNDCSMFENANRL